jgi:hypothetical protein
MKLIPIAALGAFLFYLFNTEEAAAAPAADGTSTPTPGIDVTKAEWAAATAPLPNPRSGRCFSKIDRAGFASDLISS